MRMRRVLAVGVALVGLGYIASPYVALWQLEAAARRGDVAALAAAVDFDAVREGIKEDICDAVLDDASPRVQTASAGPTALPPFGASFFAGLAAKAVDDLVTPDGLVAMLHPHPAAPAAEGAQGALGWSFFDDATDFTARLYAAGASPVLLHLQLRGGHWQVIRADVPTSMLRGMQSHA